MKLNIVNVVCCVSSVGVVGGGGGCWVWAVGCG